jgi:hypothetical protein
MVVRNLLKKYWWWPFCIATIAPDDLLAASDGPASAVRTPSVANA